MLRRTPCRTLNSPVVVLLAAALMTIQIASTVSADSAATEWPAFRGANGDGIAVGSPAMNQPGGFGLHLAWKTPLGSGYSAIAVADGHVVTMFSDGESDYVVAYDESSGSEKWRHKIAETYKGHDGSHDGPISTPLIANGRVFALAPRGEFLALALDTGKPVWSTNLVSDHGAKKPHYGFTSSPILIGGSVILQIGAPDGAIAGFEPASGKKLWAVGSDRIGYQSAIPYSIAGRDQILASGNKKLFGVDPKAGELLWEYEHGGNGAIGAQSMSAVPVGEERLFLAHKNNQSAVVNFTPTSNGVEFKTTWEDRAIRNSYNVPVYYEGHIYAYSSRFLICVDAGSGAVKWRSRQPGDGFMILAGDHLVIATKAGGVHVAKASPDSYVEVAAVPKVFEDLAWCTPAFANGKIYVRSFSEIARIDVGSPTAIAHSGTEMDAALAQTAFGRFLVKIKATPDKQTGIDAFMKSHEFPIVEGDWVHFVYRGPGTDLAVGGDLIGARQERPMRRVEGTDLFYCSMRLEPDARSNYLFIRDYGEILDPRNPRKTTTTQLTKDMEMNFGGDEMEMSWFGMPEWKAPSFLDEPPSSQRGKLETRELESKILKDSPPPGAPPPAEKPAESALVKHVIEVYLPHGYDKSTERYPVAYVFGGAAALKRGDWPRALDNLIGKRVRPMIAVFINREAPFFGGDPMMFQNMFTEELVPFIDTNYRTLAEPESRACVGSGSAANTALNTAFGSGIVRKVATQSPFLMDSMHGMLLDKIQGADKQPMLIYMDWGKYDMRNPHENWDVGRGNRRFAEKLRGKGYTVAGGEANDGCGWSSWRNRTDDILETLYPMGG